MVAAALEQPAIRPTYRQLENRIRELEGEIARLRGESPAGERRRQTLTLKAAAEAAGVSPQTACRYLNEGFWSGYRDGEGNRYWRVFIDQPLSRKTGRRRR